jgi:hypothetical protein
MIPEHREPEDRGEQRAVVRYQHTDIRGLKLVVGTQKFNVIRLGRNFECRPYKYFGKI